MSLTNPGIGIVLTYSTSLKSSIAILITIEYISNLKLRYTKLGDWVFLITVFYEKTLQQSLVDKKIDEKEALGWKEI